MKKNTENFQDEYAYKQKANICFDCQKACGGCSWSIDFTPVPGWTAEKTAVRQVYVPGYVRDLETYHITACPEFVADEPRKGVRQIRRAPFVSNEKRKVICVTTGKVYESIHEAARQTGIYDAAICAVCKGTKQSARGTVWEYVEDGEGE